MTTPVFDFVRKYAASDAVRMHMPGHKGASLIGCEPYDLTEIPGADELFAPSGIIAESENNASMLFGCQTLYSTEGSSLCIRAMLFLTMQYAAAKKKRPVIAAARNAHKTFVTAAALLGFDIVWLPQQKNYLASPSVEQMYAACKDACAVYLTSPDYLGGVADIRAAASFCHANDMLLLVDAAHGAYLHFLAEPIHPTDLGADLCCTSAHKTLPVLTGGAYLHIAERAPAVCKEKARDALALFASTSPSYLILASLDRCNQILAGEYQERLHETTTRVMECRRALAMSGWSVYGDEPMKLTVAPKTRGYTGCEIADVLRNALVYCEFYDQDFLVLMPSVHNPPEDLHRVMSLLCMLPPRRPITEEPPAPPKPVTVCTPRKAVFAQTVRLPLSECEGKICAELSVSCPPAVPIVMCGERITAEAIACMRYYGCKFCTVIS